MLNVLVTGGAGFIGSNFIRYLLQTQENVKVINLDLLTYAGSLENLTGIPNMDRYEFVKGDICSQSLVEDILRRHKINIIVHFAAETHVDRSILAPQAFIQTNVFGTLSLLDASRKVWLDEKSDNVKSRSISSYIHG